MKWICKWKVGSKSSRTRHYTVSLADDGTMGCSCPAWTRRRISCSHIKSVREEFEDEFEKILDAYKAGLFTPDYYAKIRLSITDVLEHIDTRTEVEKAKGIVREKRAARKAVADSLSTIIENAEWRMA